MIATDTNVLARIFAGDDPEQVLVVRSRLRGQRLWISKTVILELEWVLRTAYKKDRASIARTLRRLLGYRLAEIEDRSSVLNALSWFQEGMDFADAFHLASSGSATSFATFDKALARAAAGIPEAPEVLQL